MTYAASFSPDYIASRARFRASALALGCEVDAVEVAGEGPEGEELSIEMARLGAEDSRRILLISSGLHGLDGPVGAAVQARLLEEELGGWAPPDGTALVMMHALNPWGFAWNRRVDASNVSLDRNLLLPGQDYAGCSEAFHQIDSAIHPTEPRRWLDPARLRIAVLLAQVGTEPVVAVVEGGQHVYPRGLAFAGHGPTPLQQALAGAMSRWLPPKGSVLHLDVETGLAPWGEAVLLLSRPHDSPQVAGLEAVFSEPIVSRPGSAEELAARGGLGVWCAARSPEVAHEVVTLRFGGRGLVELVAALREENRAHQLGEVGSEAWVAAKARLRDALVPRDTAWREGVVKRGVEVVLRAMESVMQEAS